MKIFSAQDSEHKEFSLIEFKSELDALPLINELPKAVKLVDMFSLLNGNFVVFISCNNLKNTFDNLKSHPSALGGYFTNDTSMETLQAFYHLNKVSISDSIVAVETGNFCKFFELMAQAIKTGIQILDTKSQRNFLKNTLYLTGKSENLKNFSSELEKSKELKVVFLENLSENLIQKL